MFSILLFTVQMKLTGIKMKNNISTVIGAIAVVALIAILALETRTTTAGEFHDDPPQGYLSQEHAESIISIIETEGFDLAFTHYSNYRDISDPHFHYLRQNYVDAAAELMTYLAASSGKTFEPPYYLKK